MKPARPKRTRLRSKGKVDAPTLSDERLKALQVENARLKKLLAERDLDIEVLKEINSKKW